MVQESALESGGSYARTARQSAVGLVATVTAALTPVTGLFR